MANIVINSLDNLQVFSHDLDEFYPVVEEDQNKYRCTISLPENDGEDNLKYTFELYSDDVGTGLLTYVIVLCKDGVAYEIVDFESVEDILPFTGGNVSFTITIDTSA